jgi:integrase
MAYFRKRGDKWSYTIDTGIDSQGKRKQKTKSGFKTKKDAQNAAAADQKDLVDGLYIEESDVIFCDFCKEWLKLYSESVKESTIRVREHELGCLSFYFEKMQLRKISKKAYQNALVDLRNRGYANNTIAGIHGTGKMLFKKAREFDLIKKNPTEYAKPPRAKTTIEEIEHSDELPKYLEKKELSLFLKNAHEKGLESDYVIFLLFAYTGMRVGELCALKWSDVNFDDNTISITKTYYNPSNRTKDFKLQTPKTTSSIREIDIADIVTKELGKHQAAQNRLKMQYRKTYHDENFVFANTERKYIGYPRYIKKVELRMTRLLIISNLNEALTPHSLRHTHTSLLAEAGVGLYEIMERLGHSDDDTTKKVYLHVTQSMKKEASQKFSNLMKSL